MKRAAIIFPALIVLCLIGLPHAQKAAPAEAAALASKTPSASGMAMSIADFGAVGDGKTINTDAIQRAIDVCAAKGGGTIHVPAGRWVTGPIFLKSHITLHIDAGAVLLGSNKIDDYPVIDGRWEGVERKHYASLINGDGLKDIAVVGRGTVDGRGEVWWRGRKKLKYARGRLIGLYRCENVLIAGLMLKNSPAWTVNPIYCNNVTVTGVTIINPANSPNTDGINPDSSTNVHISNCHIDVGDDCITIKSGRDEDGRRVGRPCENITIANCTMLAGHGGVVIGSEMSGGVANVAITNCVFDGTANGIRMKTMRGRGGIVQDIRISNIVMRNVGRAIKLNMHYHKTPDEQVSERTPQFRNIHISNIQVHGAGQAFYGKGLPEMPLREVTLTNAVMTAKRGISITDGEHIEFHNVQVNTEEGPALTARDVADLEIEGFKTRNPKPNQPVIDLRDVRDVFVRGCRASKEVATFLKVAGDKAKDIVLVGNHLSKAAKPVVTLDGATSDDVEQR
jgi:polygalacturonase